MVYSPVMPRRQAGGDRGGEAIEQPNQVRITSTGLDSVVVLEVPVFTDDRGYFFESYTKWEFVDATGFKGDFVQDNHSRSGCGVIRGLHYQISPHAQAKLVRCIRGTIFDVAVDIRRSSDTFGEWFGLVLSDENKKQLLIPHGFAHGFMALSDQAEVFYKTTDYHTPDAGRGIRWDDPAIGIEWPDPGIGPILADKDGLAPLLCDAEVFD
jgi:dTDP-4-dehydrorhamnose 3,5-epimerase